MNEHQDQRPADLSGADDEVARLLRMTPPRPMAPVELTTRARAAAEAEWRRSVRRRRQKGRILFALGGALAAGVLLLVVPPGHRIPGEVTEPAVPLATLEVVRGGSVLRSWVAQEGQAQPLAIGEWIGAGSRIETCDGARAALRLASGESLRLDVSTRLQLLSNSSVLLEQGALYIASEGAGSSSQPFEVRAGEAVATEMGTQFEIRLDDHGVRVRVREGRVAVERGGMAFEAGPGDELRIDSSGDVGRRHVLPYGPAWRWNMEIAPTFDLEGSSLESYLGWLTRETGWNLRFTDPALAASAASVTLHGSLEGLSPDRTPALVLPTCGLVHRVEDGILFVEAS